MPIVVDWPKPAFVACAAISLVSEADRETMPTEPFLASTVDMTPILQAPGESTPCELGPTRRVFEPWSAARTLSMSCTGTRSVTQTTSPISASIASIIAAAAPAAGTKTMLASALVSERACRTLSKIGSMRWRLPPLPGRTPPTIRVP